MKAANLKANRIIFDAVLLLYTIVLFFLYYNQLLYPVTGMFESDTSVHVRFAVEDGFYHSLAAFIYVILSKLPFANITISLVLSLSTSFAVVACAKLIEKLALYYDVTVSKTFVYTAAFFANFVMGFYVKAANRQHYIGYQNANMWHNSTYIFMRLMAIITVILFIDLMEQYKTGLSVKQWVTYTLALAVTTGFKASFLTVFAPLMAILLLIDLCKGIKFKNVFLMGLTVVPSLVVLFLQNLILSGTGESNGYTISPFAALSLRGDHPKVTLILSVLFPVAVCVLHIRDFYKDKIYFGALIMWAVAFLEVFLLLETGKRALDSNFMWGYSIALFFLFLISMLKLYRDMVSFVKEKKIFKIVAGSVGTFILLWHVVSGVWYLCLLLTGVTYFV